MLSPPDLAPDTVAGMAGRAVDFLLSRQRVDGAWHDFFLPAGESDGWVTGYVGLALAQSGTRGRDAARRGWAHLETAVKPGGGWGYNALTPPDADSTVWALRLAEAIGAGAGEPAARGRSFLARCTRPDGGVATYAGESDPRHYVGLPETVDFSAWTRPHVCVSAAAAALGGGHDWLVAQQSADGHWPGYWWFDPGYATAEAVEALGPGPATTRARAFARRRLDDAGLGAFALAHAIRILGADTPGAAIDALAARQDANGSWPASARLRVPAPDRITPGEADGWKPWRGLTTIPTSLAQVLDMTFTITSLDHRRAFTTATVLRALTALK